MNKSVRTLLFWSVIVFSAVLLWRVVRADGGPSNATAIPEISYSKFLAQIADGQVSKVVIVGNVVQGYDAKGSGFRVVAPANQFSMLEALQRHGVEIWFKDVSGAIGATQILGTWGPLIMLGALWFFMIRQMKTAARVRATSQTSSTPDPQTRFGP